MIRSFKERRDSEQGFTLIELMVVVLIIAILLAIAVPTFLGARERAQERAAQSNVRNAFSAAKTIYTDSQNWSGVTAAAVQGAEPSLTVTGTTSDVPKKVGLLAADDYIVLVVKSANNKCFFLGENINQTGAAGTFGAAKGSRFLVGAPTSGVCTADTAGTTWADKW